MKTPPPFKAPVTEWHNASYAAISPEKASLSMVDRTVVITGGGTGIGQETVRTFAAAGSTAIHILGRTQSSLAETKTIVEKEFPAASVTVHVVDISDEMAVSKAAKEIGKWDVLVSNAAYFAKKATIAESELADWWACFEINVKGSFILAQAFFPNRKHGASVVAVSSAIVCAPAGMLPGSAPYAASKLAQVRLFEYVASEYPDLQVVTIHPGTVKTAMSAKAEAEGLLPLDDVKLPAHFILWAASSEAAFANGRFLWCNWDVDELKAMSGKFKEDPLFMTSNILGGPYA